MEATLEKRDIAKAPRDPKWFSGPLFKQSIKANWVMWLSLTIASALIFVIINLVVGTQKLFTNIDMAQVMQYVQEEDMNWLQILGLLERMGFSLSRIQVMSQIDLNSVLNDLIYRIAGVFLPMIYIMITANKLVAAQVSDGSMAYVLSTPTTRKRVVFTTSSFLFLSIIAMYIVITICAFSTDWVAHCVLVQKGYQDTFIPLRTILYCFGSFCAIVALAGICYGASCWFNKSSQSLGVGGTVCVVCFLCCILGLFGNQVFVSVGVGVPAMYVFNYASIFTLIDTDSMGAFAKNCAGVATTTEGMYDWIWKCAIMLAIGIIFVIIGAQKFKKKDLPL